ncbi:MAG: NAD-dependent epimerase/dehydratase family protein, partial [Chloroflexi bacterium]|nr:NAD-dependent epimerase/dehydratase family protein [Chloroflexota bacterium]
GCLNEMDISNAEAGDGGVVIDGMEVTYAVLVESAASPNQALVWEQVREVVRNHDVAIHMAATHGGRGYIDTHPADCCKSFAINHNVIEEACQAGVDRVHFSSSTCVYPMPLQSEYGSSYLLKEDTVSRDSWASCDREYGWAKLMGEMELWAFQRQYGLKCSITRYVVVYGERENDTHAVIALIRKAVEKRDPYVIWGTGEQDRAFVYVSDVVDGTLLGTEKIEDGTPINLGTYERYKIKDVAAKILDATGHKPQRIVFDETKPEGALSRGPDISRAKELLGWEPKVTFDEGLRRTIDWFVRVRPESVETIVD